MKNFKELVEMDFNKPFAILAMIFSTTVSSYAQGQTQASAELRFDATCILEAAFTYMGITPRSEIAVPSIHLGSVTPLSELNDALYPHQWSTPAVAFSNAFAYKNGHNKIFLLDDAAYNAKHGRYTDDSLAHELIHFLQVRYYNSDLETDPFSEADAVAFQNEFREKFMIPPNAESPCE